MCARVALRSGPMATKTITVTTCDVCGGEGETRVIAIRVEPPYIMLVPRSSLVAIDCVDICDACERAMNGALTSWLATQGTTRPWTVDEVEADESARAAASEALKRPADLDLAGWRGRAVRLDVRRDEDPDRGVEIRVSFQGDYATLLRADVERLRAWLGEWLAYDDKEGQR